MTCAHVARNVGAVDGRMKVNGAEATLAFNDDGFGLDLCLLKTQGVAAAPAQIAATNSKAGETINGFGYSHLYEDHYAGRLLSAKVKESVTLRRQASDKGFAALLIEATKGVRFTPGNSGTAMLDANGEVAGVLAFASRDGALGYAISGDAVRQFLNLPQSPAMNGAAMGAGQQARRAPPPPLGEIRHDDDPQKGRFGGVSNDGVAELVATYRGQNGSSYFTFDVTVRPAKRGGRLLGPARFFLHDTFPRQMIQISRVASDGSLTLYEVSSYGAFTVGCQVCADDGSWRELEYDLADWPYLPKIFRER